MLHHVALAVFVVRVSFSPQTRKYPTLFTDHAKFNVRLKYKKRLSESKIAEPQRIKEYDYISEYESGSYSRMISGTNPAGASVIPERLK